MIGLVIWLKMKSKEKQILEKLNEFTDWDLKEVNYEYSRFDAYGDDFIVEIKDRGTYYEKVMIEFDKYSFNKEYDKISSIKNKKNYQFIYAVGMEDEVYLFNISDLDRMGHNYCWEWRELPKSTEFNKKGKVKKLVGYININYIVGVIDERDK